MPGYLSENVDAPSQSLFRLNEWHFSIVVEMRSVFVAMMTYDTALQEFRVAT